MRVARWAGLLLPTYTQVCLPAIHRAKLQRLVCRLIPFSGVAAASGRSSSITRSRSRKNKPPLGTLGYSIFEYEVFGAYHFDYPVFKSIQSATVFDCTAFSLRLDKYPVSIRPCTSRDHVDTLEPVGVNLPCLRFSTLSDSLPLLSQLCLWLRSGFLHTQCHRYYASCLCGSAGFARIWLAY
ncbi:hypothetical protein OH76DRAFT_1220075 [Lentinus brumalis]|uniref:Uncharacterized protein n=1 Tax=Lentinus brumalis TaxID=2498619 RepID=A0A371DLL2_9APHY|nr:hypothetical protein OH76DRAFT_1220075 [Polyporus brumalis]